MGIFMTVNTEVFPIASVGRIVMMITVLVMYGQEVTVGLIELTSAMGADEPVNCQRTFPVILVV